MIKKIIHFEKDLFLLKDIISKELKVLVIGEQVPLAQIT